MKLIVATNNLGYIGRGGQMMWRCKEDFKHFKTLTSGGKTKEDDGIPYNVLLVGNTTFQQDLGGKQLPNRLTFPIGSGIDCFTLPTAVKLAISRETLQGIDSWVIGGSSIYKQLLPICTEIHWSHINDDQVGDTKFEVPANYTGTIYHYYFEPDERIEHI